MANQPQCGTNQRVTLITDGFMITNSRFLAIFQRVDGGFHEWED